LTLLITAAVVAGAGVAGAADSANVYARDTPNGSCSVFTSQPGGGCVVGARGDVTIEAGETVTWDFAGTTLPHNVKAANDVAADPTWKNVNTPFDGQPYTRQFMEPGEYQFVCFAHQTTMVGTVTVIEGDGTATPIPTETATPTPSPTATSTPAPTVQASTATDDHTQTPAPGHGAKDKVAPKVQTMRLRARARELTVRFWLSEPATVRITAKRRGSKGTLASSTVQSPAGTRTVKLRSKRFKRGTYTVSLRVTDAMGNKATAPRKNVRLRSSR
jgi:plastocyanin